MGTEAMPVFDTQSEQDFFQFCERQRWTATKFGKSCTAGTRTLDFLIKTSTDYAFVVEVTEFEPEAPLAAGQFRVRGHTLGNALRAKLAEKKGQVRAHADHLPTLIVISADFDHLAEVDPMAFDSALYGDVSVTVSVPTYPNRIPEIAEELHNAGRSFFGPTHNTSVSAVAALIGRPQSLRIYHNNFAKRQLDPARTVLGTTNVEHFVKPEGGLCGWEKLY